MERQVISALRKCKLGKFDFCWNRYILVKHVPKEKLQVMPQQEGLDHGIIFGTNQSLVTDTLDQVVFDGSLKNVLSLMEPLTMRGLSIRVIKVTIGPNIV